MDQLSKFKPSNKNGGHKKKKRQDLKSYKVHTFFKIMVLLKRYGMLRHLTTKVQNMVKMIMVFKSIADSEHKIFQNQGEVLKINNLETS